MRTARRALPSVGDVRCPADHDDDSNSICELNTVLRGVKSIGVLPCDSASVALSSWRPADPQQTLQELRGCHPPPRCLEAPVNVQCSSVWEQVLAASIVAAAAAYGAVLRAQRSAPMFGAMLGGAFADTYKCHSMSMLAAENRRDPEMLEASDKVMLPPSTLEKLSRLEISYPMMFELTNPHFQDLRLHCGVLEFVAPEGMIYLPYWMMENLHLHEGDLLHVRSSTIPKGSYVKLQPQTSDFIKISNPKAVLEATLRNFSALTKGEVWCSIPWRLCSAHPTVPSSIRRGGGLSPQCMHPREGRTHAVGAPRGRSFASSTTRSSMTSASWR